MNNIFPKHKKTLFEIEITRTGVQLNGKLLHIYLDSGNYRYKETLKSYSGN